MAEVNKPEERQGVGTRASLPARRDCANPEEALHHVGTRAPLPARDATEPRESQPGSARIQRHTSGHLPHYDSPDLIQFVTFRLADSLPKDILKTLRSKLESRQISEIEYFRSVERALDVGTGPAFLMDERIAQIVAETLIKFDGEKYDLFNWVLMPNHAHILFRMIAPHKLSQAVHSIKGFTASAANKILERSGSFWSPDYFDRFTRDRRHLVNVKKYIDQNPVKAGLCETPEEWPWGSAGWRG